MCRDGTDYWLIDGQSVLRPRGRGRLRFEILLALTYHLLRQDIDFLCVLAPSVRWHTGEHRGRDVEGLCAELIDRFPKRFSEVPADVLAEEAILDIALIFGPKIISNNEYRSHTERYPWLETQREEILSTFTIQRDSQRRRELLLWGDSTIAIPGIRKFHSFVNRYKQLLSDKEPKR
jgi:hypothetical protein